MVATVSVKVDTGGTSGTPGTSTDIDALGPPTLQFRTEDASTVDTAKPIVIPTSGTNYSYTKSIYYYSFMIIFSICYYIVYYILKHLFPEFSTFKVLFFAFV